MRASGFVRPRGQPNAVDPTSVLSQDSVWSMLPSTSSASEQYYIGE